MIDSFSIRVNNTFTPEKITSIYSSQKCFLTSFSSFLNKEDYYFTIKSNNISFSINKNAIFSSLITDTPPTVSLRISIDNVTFIQSNPIVNISCSLKGLLQEFFTISFNILHVTSSAVIKRKTSLLNWEVLRKIKSKIEGKQNRLKRYRFCLFRL